MMANPDNGALMSMVLRDDQFIPVQGQYGSDWRADKERSGAGALLEHSIHDLDILEWLAGPVVSIDARSASHHGLDGIEDVVVASMAFESGALASLTSVWHDVLSRPSLRRLEVFFERAWFSLEHELTGPLRWQRADGEDGGLEGAELSRAADEVGAGWDDPAARFVHAAAAGEPTWPDFRTALRAHVLTDAAYRSAASGGAPQPV
jgi:predicted dehydrogenase